MSWTCSELKTRAKYSLTNKYWSALLASLILVGITYGVTWIISLFSSFAMIPAFFSTLLNNSYSYNTAYGGYAFFQVMTTFLPSIAITMVLSILPQFFLYSPMTVGGNNWYSRNREMPSRPNYKTLFCAFQSKHYLKVVGATAYPFLFQLLWSLPYIGSYILFFVFFAVSSNSDSSLLMLTPLLLLVTLGLLALPIIASLRYTFIPWILADNPEIGYRRAMELSKQMTYGQKGHIFGLYWSFFPWYLAVLGAAFLTCGFGAVSIVFLVPYLQATQAELYAQCRHNAIQSGLCSFEELGFLPQSAPQPQASPSDPNGPTM